MDFRSLLKNFPSGAEKELFIREVSANPAHFLSLLELALHEKGPHRLAGQLGAGWKR